MILDDARATVDDILFEAAQAEEQARSDNNPAAAERAATYANTEAGKIMQEAHDRASRILKTADDRAATLYSEADAALVQELQQSHSAYIYALLEWPAKSFILFALLGFTLNVIGSAGPSR